MARPFIELRSVVHKNIVQERFHLGQEGINLLLDAGRQWQLASVLQSGGALIFPHTYLHACGHQVAAVVHACLDSGADRILAIGVLHALANTMIEAREQEARGEDIQPHLLRGIQGPGLQDRCDWIKEFSLRNFEFLLEKEVQRRGTVQPKLYLRYPFLVGGAPEKLPGIEELHEIAKDAAIVATGDLFHHGIGYGESPLTAFPQEAGGIDLAKQRILESISLLEKGSYDDYRAHAFASHNDAVDVGQVLRFLLGPLQGSILDIVACDTSLQWDSLPPTWVAASLVELRKSRKK